MDLPHAATYQARMGTPVPFDQLQPADLVFFGSPSFYHHVGIYAGNGRFIEAPHTGDVVKVSVLAGRGTTLACRFRCACPDAASPGGTARPLPVRTARVDWRS